LINYFKSYSSLGDDLFLCHPFVSFSRHLCSWRDARVDKPMPTERLLGKITSRIQTYLH